MFRASFKHSVSMLALLTAAGAARAAQNDMVAAADPNASGVFGLGQIEQVTITASPLSQAVSESTVSAEDIYKFNALTLDRALDLVPGAASGTTGGARNERLFFIRGFDRFQSPLYVDGIRVYLPYDNRLDVGFFATANLAQVQIQKGYVSVLSGPGAIGGAINLVTRKPVQPFEYEARAGASFSGNGDYNGYAASARIGGSTDRYYWQASGAATDVRGFRLSDDFTPTPMEDGGFRDRSNSRNYNANLKFGFTPNATDEYSLSYSGQWGKKEATLSTTEPASTQRYWTWPYSDLQSIYFLSNTAIGSNAYVKTKVYYNSFRSGLYSYDNANYNSQSTPRAFRSYYSDYAYGGSIEAGYDFAGRDTLKAAFFYRSDSHTERQTIYAPPFTEPDQESVEDTFSVAAENRFRVTEALDFVVGVSYDWRHLSQAQDYITPTGSTPGVFIDYPLADGHAANVQAALIYNYSGTGHVHASVSDRGRFPTLFERFSTRFGATISNPNLKAERATNYEIGAADTVFGATRIEGAVFYSEMTDALVNVPIQFCDTTSAQPPNCTGAGGNSGRLTNTMQTQNIGDGNFYGYEFSADSPITDRIQAGVRFTYVNRHITAQNPENPPVNPTFHLTGVPYSQVFGYVTLNVTSRLSLTPNILAASDRWTNTQSGTSYFKTGAFFLLNLDVHYAVTDRIDIQLVGRNLLDADYELAGGFPQEGRSFFVNLRISS